MSDFRDIEVKAGNQSFIVTTVVGILCMCLLLLNMKFNKDVKVYQPIEIAMNFEPIEIPEITIEEPIIQDNAISEEVANYGNSQVGQGSEEPKPAEQKTVSPSVTKYKSENPSKKVNVAPTKKILTTDAKDNRPSVNSGSATKDPDAVLAQNPTPKPQGDPKAKSALDNIVGGKGKGNSGGQGNDGVPGNVGDPKGSATGTGGNIGENWLSRIPEPQSHDCSSSGVIVVNIVVNANGSIKSATPGGKGSTSNDACLQARAKSLVMRYVKAKPGADGRLGSYKVNLK